MKSAIYILAMFISVAGFSQTVRLKKGNITVDDKLWLKYDGCGGWDRVCSVMSLEGEEIIYMTLETVKYSEDKYWKVKFLGLNQTLEIPYAMNGGLLKKFYVANVVNADGTLNPDKVSRMVEKYGNPNAEAPETSNTQTIIIKDETPKPGVQINIGR
ncbi:MAG: hypothetical protein EOO50_03390 [Flavobacterium sp.]|uniref:hypothetical protein n=1 Tax=Flavobacterium sp. TaxID=239 RepID=UPI0012162385|nr:hypothetical protein [Flavobacterium sp.]RZJ67878.1 MAG: hypothetical protein EOO50_03390 [Flavobacterium sp.]